MVRASTWGCPLIDQAPDRSKGIGTRETRRGQSRRRREDVQVDVLEHRPVQPPGTSAGSTSPIRRQPFDSSHVRGAATSGGRSASAYPARRRAALLPAVEPQTRTRAVQHHRRHPPATLAVVLARVQEDVRQRPADLPSASASARGGNGRPERGLCARRPGSRSARNRAARLFMPFARRSGTRRLHDEVRMVVLDRVVDYAEPGARRALAKRLPEARTKHPRRSGGTSSRTRSVMSTGQRPGMAPRCGARPASGGCAAVPRPAVRRRGRWGPELEAGLPGLGASAGPTRSPACSWFGDDVSLARGVTFVVLHSRRGYSKLLYMSTEFLHAPTENQASSEREHRPFNPGGQAGSANPVSNRRRPCLGQTLPRLMEEGRCSDRSRSGGLAL